MALSDFLSTTDANNQKQYYDQDIVITTSTSSIISKSIPYSMSDLPDVRAWVRPTLIANSWKSLTDLQLLDGFSAPSEDARGEIGVDSSNVIISMLPTSLSPIAFTVRVRIYYND